MTDRLQLGFASFETDWNLRIDEQISRALRGQPWPLTAQQRDILNVLKFHRGAENAIKLDALCAKVKISDRECKELVRALIVDFGVSIGASRQKPYGYYLIRTIDEARTAAEVYVGEIRQLSRRVRVLLGLHATGELLGQLRIDLDKESA